MNPGYSRPPAWIPTPSSSVRAAATTKPKERDKKKSDSRIFFENASREMKERSFTPTPPGNGQGAASTAPATGTKPAETDDAVRVPNLSNLLPDRDRKTSGDDVFIPEFLRKK